MPITPSPLLPEELRSYSNQHPLFNRLSGEVVWLLFEENDADADDINAFMDTVIATREEQCAVLATLTKQPELYLRITLTDEGPACEKCKALHGAVLPASHPDLKHWIAPFALGCRCRMEAVSKDEIAPGTPQLDQLECPSHQLHCPSEWLFRHRWSK